jgi:hypothetical protein
MEDAHIHLATLMHAVLDYYHESGRLMTGEMLDIFPSLSIALRRPDAAHVTEMLARFRRVIADSRVQELMRQLSVDCCHRSERVNVEEECCEQCGNLLDLHAVYGIESFPDGESALLLVCAECDETCFAEEDGYRHIGIV